MRLIFTTQLNALTKKDILFKNKYLLRKVNVFIIRPQKY